MTVYNITGIRVYMAASKTNSTLVPAAGVSKTNIISSSFVFP